MSGKTLRKAKRSAKTKTAQRKTAQRQVGITSQPKMYLKGLSKCDCYLTYFTSDQTANLFSKKKLVLPPYQRPKNQWKAVQDQDLIMTMINGYPVLPFLLQYENGVYYLLNGNQRLWNQMRFRKNQIKILKKTDGTYGGMKYKDLEPETKKKYDSYPIAMQVIVGGNGIGVKAYIQANSGVPINKAQKRRAVFHKTAFHKKVIAVGKKVQKFYTENNVIRPNDFIKCKNEEIIAENILLVTQGITDGAELDNKYLQMEKPTQLNRYITKDPVQLLNGYFRTIKSMFPKGLIGTGFDNINNFYGLLGAVKNATEQNIIPDNARDKALIGDALVKLLEDVKKFSRTNQGSNSAMLYHKTITRGTRDYKNREDRIQVLVDVIARN